eukprot:1850529-Pleurochrysis_carterae.AAC.1
MACGTKFSWDHESHGSVEVKPQSTTADTSHVSLDRWLALVPRWRLQQSVRIPCTDPVHERARPKLNSLSQLSVTHLFELRTEASHPFNKRHYKSMRTHDLVYNWLQHMGMQLPSTNARYRLAYFTKIETALAHYEAEKDRLRQAVVRASKSGSASALATATVIRRAHFYA